MKKLYIVLALFAQQVLAKDFKGAELYSTEPVLYGRFDMCMRSNKVSGTLSTFFLYKEGSELQGAFWEEIDIEIFGKGNSQSMQSNIITGKGTRTHSEEVHSFPFSLADDFHVYSLEWTPDYVAWYLDGQLLRKSEGGQVDDLKNPMGLRFNTWASSAPEWVGPFESTQLPAQQMVDWISYSEYTPGTGTAGSDFTFSWKDDFNSVSAARWSKADWTFDGNLVDFLPGNAQAKEGKLVLSITPAGQSGYSGVVPTTGCSDVLGVEPTLHADPAFKLVYQPEAGSFSLISQIPNAFVSVTNMEGRFLGHFPANAPFGSTFNKGLYVCTLQLGGRTLTRKVIK